MIGQIGKILIISAFVISLAALFTYYKAAKNQLNLKLEKNAHRLFALMGLIVVAVSGLLIYLIFTHQFQYYYVYDHTSLNLQKRYLMAAFYSGQTGSFLLWIMWTALVGWALIKWTDDEFRAPVMVFVTLIEVFLLSMLLGFSIGPVHIGASPFRTLSEAMPNAPFLRAHPDFVPADGNGLNDLLKSPWILIHPPILFFGFAMMTVPFSYAMAALWKRKYTEWIKPVLPWTIGANLCLITAIFLGGYWAYVTLSFGGYWAWDPVENASFVPWLIGVAALHAMLVQRGKDKPKKTSILFSLFTFIAVAYESFLTRSGVLGDSSVHSFVDLGLYDQLVFFLLAVTLIALVMFFYRWKDLPKSDGTSRLLSRDFVVFTGAMVIFLSGLVIILGTSSPVIGKLFVSHPTPPPKSFYNNWTMPLAIAIALLSVIGQYVWWKKYDAESLSEALLGPLVISSILAIATIIFGNIHDIAYMVYIFAGYFGVVGNAFIIVRLYKKQPKLIGGAITHIGFAVMLIGILASSAYQTNLLDPETKAYNNAVEQGKVVNKDGTTVMKQVNFFQLDKGQPKKIDKNLTATFVNMKMDNATRPGQQKYTIKFHYKNGKTFLMHPVVYPMLTTSSANKINWSVSPQVKAGLFHDIYLYVGGSSYVQNINDELKNNPKVENVTERVKNAGQDDSSTQGNDNSKKSDIVSFKFHRGQSKTIDGYTFTFTKFQKATNSELPDSSVIGVHALITIKEDSTGATKSISPLFAVVQKNGKKMSYSPPIALKNWNFAVQFSNVKPMSDEIQLSVSGLKNMAQNDQDAWVVVVAERKPFVSLVWAGIFILMIGFSISILRRWADDKRRTERMKAAKSS
jgi:cytochrome c-type biogenesis protein CcmF